MPTLYVFDHGAQAFQELGDEAISQSAGNVRPSPTDPFVKLASKLPASGIIHLRGCSIAKGVRGENYVQALANLANRTVTAYTADGKIGGGPPYYTPGGTLITKSPQTVPKN